MHVILHMSMSLNGMISREDDDTDFLSYDNWEIFVALTHEVGALIWGRKTHEVVRSFGQSYLDDLQGVPKVVVSSAPTLALEPGWQHAHSPKEALDLLEAQQRSSVLLVGGARLNTAFARQGWVNEVILNIEPVIVGTGIPLFSADTFDLRLHLTGTKSVGSHLLQLRYSVDQTT